MLIPLAALWMTGVVVAVPFVVWWTRDFGRIPGRIWYWSGYDRRAWQWAVFLGFLAGGVIAIVTVLRWAGSDARTELLDDLHERIAEHDARVAAAAAAAADRGAEVRADVRDAQRSRAAQAAHRPQGAAAVPEPHATPVPDPDNVSVLRPGAEPRPAPPAPKRAVLRRVH